MANRQWVCIGIVNFTLLATANAWAGITDFTAWSQVQDPADPHFTSLVNSASSITLSASGGPVSAATDIGYQSVNGNSFTSSTAGYAFSPSSDFSVAVDFNLAVSGSGGLGVGFGLGEDRNGMNSAGVAMLTVNGSPSLVFAGAARINDVNQSAQPIVTVPAQNSGRLILSYNAASGNVVAGVSTNGDDTPEGTTTFTGIQHSWANQPLLVSFFMRSDNSLSTAWSSGTANAAFTNFHVISGAPIVVPEPSSWALAALATVGLALLYRRCPRVVARD
jgi:hypothetical protein